MRRALKIILAVVIAVAVISTVRYCANPYSTQTVTYYEYEKSVGGQGYILRDETVVTNNISGTFEPYINEGERVSRDAKVGTVISGAPDESLTRELGEVNLRIKDIEESTTIAGIYQSDAARIANAVTENVKNIRTAVKDGDLSRATELKREIGYLKSRAAQIEGSEPTDRLLSQLYERKTQIEAALGASQTEIFSPISGVYSRAVDGLESYGSAEAVAALTPGDVESFDEILGEYQQNPRDVCKISDNFTWYLAAVIDEAEAQGISLGAQVSVKIDVDNAREVEGRIFSLSEAVDGKCVLVVSSDLFVEGISSLRKVDYEVILLRKSGLRIPSSALRIENGKKGVYILLDKTKSFRYVNDNPYRSEDDQYYIVEPKYTPQGVSADYVPLKEYDKVLIDPEEVR